MIDSAISESESTGEQGPTETESPGPVTEQAPVKSKKGKSKGRSGGKKAASDSKASDLIKKAGALGVKGADDSLKAISAFMAGKERQNKKGPAKASTFGDLTEEDYAQIKEHLHSAWKNFKEAGLALKEFFKLLVEEFGAAIKPYIVRFQQEIKSLVGRVVDVRKKTQTEVAAKRLSEDIYERYELSRIEIPGAKPHPGYIVESVAMSEVAPPEPRYKPTLPAHAVESGAISEVQLEAVVYAGEAHSKRLLNGLRKAFMIGDGTGVGKARIIAAIIADNFMYQEAAPVLLEYIQFIRENAERRQCHPNCGAAPVELGLTNEVAFKAMALFDQALAAARSDAVRARVEKASIPAYRTLILVNGYPWRVENGICRRDWPEPYRGLVPRYIALCKQYGMTMVSEQLSAQEYFDRLVKMESMPALRIENGTWRLTVLPEQNGKLVEMFHKPTGRCLLPAILRDNILQGALDEVGQMGLASNAFTAFEGEADADRIRLHRSLDDGSTVERVIRLQDEVIAFESHIHHRGPAPKLLQFRVRPEFDAFTGSTDSDVVSVYIKAEEWEKINRGWAGNSGPDKDRMLRARGGGFAYFNHEVKAGVRIDYPPDCVKSPQLWWRPQYQQVNLELFSQEQEVAPGQALSMAYRFRFLAEPPTGKE